MKVVRTANNILLVDSNMRIIPEALSYSKYLAQQGKSPNTISSYLRDLKTFYEWMEREELQVFEVRPRHMSSFIEFVDSKHIKGRVSPPTLNRYLATLSSFYGYFEVVGGGFVQELYYKPKTKGVNRQYLRHVTRNWNKSVFSYFKRKVPKKADKKRLSLELAHQFYMTIDKLWGENETLKIRNKLIFKVLYETGLRIGELLHLRIPDYDLPEPFSKTGNIYLVLRNDDDEDRQLKTGERIIPVSVSLLEEIDDYVTYHRPYKEGVEYIFVSHSTGNEGDAPTRQSMELFFSDTLKASGITNKIVTPHSLRHTHASNLQDLGVDIIIIKERLGHASLLSTEKYAKPSLQTLTMAYERYLDTKGGEF